MQSVSVLSPALAPWENYQRRCCFTRPMARIVIHLQHPNNTKRLEYFQVSRFEGVRGATCPRTKLALESHDRPSRSDTDNRRERVLQSIETAFEHAVDMRARALGSQREFGDPQSSSFVRIFRSIRPQRCRATSRGVSPPLNRAPGGRCFEKCFWCSGINRSFNFWWASRLGTGLQQGTCRCKSWRL